MATREQGGDGRTEREAYYEALLDEQEASGLSVAAFATASGRSVATLYWWRRRLGRAVTRVGRAALLEVCVLDDGEVSAASGRMTLTVAGGTRIEVAADFDESALERLLGVLDRC